jgi:hypothetical protein
MKIHIKRVRENGEFWLEDFGERRDDFLHVFGYFVKKKIN